MLKTDSIIISGYEYQQVLYRYKNNNPKLNIKILSTCDVFNYLSTSMVSDPIPYLISIGFSYTEAIKYIDIIHKCVDPNKNFKVKEIYDKLIENNYLTKDEYGPLFFKDKNVYLFEDDEDEEIKNILKANNIAFTIIHFDDLDYKVSDFFLYDNKDSPEKPVRGPFVYSYDTKYQQFFNLFSIIRKQLIDDPTKKNKICLLIEPLDEIYLKNIGALFGIDVLIIKNTSLSSEPAIASKIKEIYKNKSFDCLDDNLKDPILKSLSDIVNKYGLKDLDFDRAYSNLIEILRSQTFVKPSTTKGIVVGNRYNIDLDKEVYVTNFKHGCFYQEYDDNNVLSDEELVALGINASYHKTLLDKRLKLNYIKYSNIKMLSFASKHLTDSIYPSQFLEDKSLDWKNNLLPAKDNLDGLFTSPSDKMSICNQLDKIFYASKEGEVNSHDHTYKGVDARKIFDKDSWSITDIERLYRCPFAYLMSKILPLDNDDYSFRYRGTIVHKVMEKLYEEDYDFEKEFQKGVEECEASARKDGVTIDKKTYAYFDVLKHWSKQFVTVFKENKLIMHLIPPLGQYGDSEIPISYEITDEKENVFKFSGRIDKIIFTAYQGKQYYTIVDYKSGVESFDLDRLFVGENLQLPLYYMAVDENINPEQYVGNATFGGFGISSNYLSTIKSKIVNSDHILSKKTITAKTCIDGLFNLNDNYGYSIDSTSFTSKGAPKKGQVINRTKGFTELDADENLMEGRFIKNLNFNSLMEISKEMILMILSDIMNNKFDIAPRSKDPVKFDRDKLVCADCHYKDICYHNKGDAVDRYHANLHAANQYLLSKDKKENKEEDIDA